MRVRLNGWWLLSDEHIENAFTLTLILLAGKLKPSVDSRRRSRFLTKSGKSDASNPERRTHTPAYCLGGTASAKAVRNRSSEEVALLNPAISNRNFARKASVISCGFDTCITNDPGPPMTCVR